MTKYFYTATGNLEIIDTPNTAQASARAYPWHTHLRHWTAGHIAAGAVHLTLENTTRRYRANDTFLIPPKMPHQLVVEPGSALTVLSYTDPAELAGLTSLFFRSKNNAAPFVVGEGLLKLLLTARNTPEICQQTEAIQAEGMANAIGSIAARIVAWPQAEFSLAAMAEYAGFSRWHFLRCFRAHIGMSPHALQTQCRLRLLRTGIRMDADLASLAVSTGFTDQSHMHKLFKRHHCLTPKQFRQASFKLSL